METLLLNKETIKKLIDMNDAIKAVEETFKGMGEGAVINPAKLTLDLGEISSWPPYKGFMNAMPAYVGWLDSAGLKWVGGFLENRERNLPYLTGMILLITKHIFVSMHRSEQQVGLIYKAQLIQL